MPAEVRHRGAGPDVFDPRRYARGVPYGRYRVLRDHCPVAWQDEPEVLGWPAGPGFWAVTRHADVVRVLKDSATYSSCLGATQIRDPDPADLPFVRRMMLNQDPPHHLRLRRLVSRAFTPGRVARFREAVRGRARSLVAGALAEARAGDGTCDVVARVTDEYALLNLTDLLGVPPGDRGLLLHWTRRVIGYQDPDEASDTSTADGSPVDPRSPSALADMFGYARELAAHKRRHPGDDVLTALATDAELTVPELEMFFFLLRRHPPVLTFRRTAAHDTTLAGTRVRAGEKVVVLHASANHDERVFPHPYRLDLTRSPNPHVSFGDGPHVCLGAHFARLQLATLYDEFRTALPTPPRLAEPPRRLTSNFINGLKFLRLELPAG